MNMNNFFKLNLKKRRTLFLIGIVLVLFILSISSEIRAHPYQEKSSKSKTDLSTRIRKIIKVKVDKSRYYRRKAIRITYDCSSCTPPPCHIPNATGIYLHKNNVGIDQIGHWYILGYTQASRNSLSTTIPAGVPLAGNYVVTIRYNSKCWGRSNVFQITSPPRVILHNVTRPKAREVLTFGKNYRIRWIKQNGWSNNVSVLLRKPNTSGQDIVLGSSNGNTFLWNVGKCHNKSTILSEGDGYKIIIKDGQNQSRLINSGLFSLHLPSFNIKVTNISAPNALKRRGHTLSINWSIEPALSRRKEYEVILEYDPSSTRHHASSHKLKITNRTRMNWLIPVTYTPGNPSGFPGPDSGHLICKIQIRLKDMKFVKGYSRNFRIE